MQKVCCHEGEVGTRRHPADWEAVRMVQTRNLMELKVRSQAERRAQKPQVQEVRRHLR